MGLFAALAREKRLVAPYPYLRKVPSTPKQITKWLDEMHPDSGDGMPQWAYDEGMARTRMERQVLIPNWSRSRDRVEMQVDHIVELQLTRSTDRGWADSIVNYELLDQATNGSTGSQIKANIEEERRRLATEEADEAWYRRDLVFDEVIADGGDSGERWTREDMQMGEHILALRRLRPFTVR